jgi:TRAP-type mannitol/chloroaromatic compound transport system permease large subunit
MILMLVTASNLFGAVFSRLGSAEYLASLLTSLALPPTLMLIVILGLIFVLGWPLEWVPIVLIVVPIVLPIVQAAGIDMIWFCTLVAMTLQTAWLSPPVALSAYFLKGVVPQWELRTSTPACRSSWSCRSSASGWLWHSRNWRPGW